MIVMIVIGGPTISDSDGGSQFNDLTRSVPTRTQVSPSALPQDDQALSYQPPIDSKAPAAVARVFEDILGIAEKNDMPGEDSY